MNAFPGNFTTLMCLMAFSGIWWLANPVTPNAQQEVAYQNSLEEFTRDNLTPFAGVYKQIAQINNTYAQRVIQSDNPVQAEVLQQEAHRQMNRVIVGHGLSIEDYNTIFRTIQSHAGLRKEFMTVLYTER
ncbi:MAG: DUF4168 domain-containing protein [Nitrospirales bacterium]|nr:DUF4168 domain-containing protein [Nitrospirales bacterium]